jgi:hypothetical protein
VHAAPVPERLFATIFSAAAAEIEARKQLIDVVWL